MTTAISEQDGVDPLYLTGDKRERRGLVNPFPPSWGGSTGRANVDLDFHERSTGGSTGQSTPVKG